MSDKIYEITKLAKKCSQNIYWKIQLYFRICVQYSFRL